MLKKLIASICIGCLILSASLSIGFSHNIQGKRVDDRREWNSRNTTYKLNSLSEHKYYLEEIEKKILENIEGLEILTSEDLDTDMNGELDEKYFLDYELNMRMFTLKDIGKHVEIWVANDLSYSDGDLRSPDSISDEQVNRIKTHFEELVSSSKKEDDSIYRFLNGENALLVKEGSLPKDYYTVKSSESRLIILVDNIKDEQYYNESQSVLIPGYFWGLLEKYMDRDIIIINSRNLDKNMESSDVSILNEAFYRMLNDNEKDKIK